MIDQPLLELKCSAGNSFTTDGELADRILHFAKAWSQYYQTDIPKCKLESVGTRYAHQGLGHGTQLALATATALNAVAKLPDPSPEELAASVGRGRRSGIGTFGYRHGGFIYESGRKPDEDFSKLSSQHPFPEEWKFLLIMQSQLAGCHGQAESKAFENIPPVSEETTNQLNQILTTQLIPALEIRDFEGFSESLYRYGYKAGLCYESVQGGAFMSRLNDQIVESLRADGVYGVGQSSWGPTIFALCQNTEQATKAQANLQNQFKEQAFEYSIASPINHGARLHECHEACAKS
jgi:beta-ribofuranosylaminobenzene 5'-phosphate synthase